MDELYENTTWQNCAMPYPVDTCNTRNKMEEWQIFLSPDIAVLGWIQYSAYLHCQKFTK